MFLRGTFDWVGTYPDFLHVGDFKTGDQRLHEKTFTPAHREMSESLNRDTFEQLVRAIADGRQKPEAEVRALIDHGPFQPEAAVEAGLVDDLAYEDELDDVADLSGHRSSGLRLRAGDVGCSWDCPSIADGGGQRRRDHGER